MERYDEGYLKNVEKQVDAIREQALEKVRSIYPDAAFVIDNRTLDDYCDKVWDYPGQWYTSFRLPKGFSSKQKLIDVIAADTLRYLSDSENKKKHKKR